MKTPYSNYVEDLLQARQRAEAVDPDAWPVEPVEPVAEEAGNVLIFSPHPDDECITGALPLRLRQQAGLNVVNVAVTLGSNLDRRQGRLAELEAACEYLGFKLENPVPAGLENINPAGREASTADWQQAVETIAEVITRYQPVAIFIPHAKDWNSTHIGTHTWE